MNFDSDEDGGTGARNTRSLNNNLYSPKPLRELPDELVPGRRRYGELVRARADRAGELLPERVRFAVIAVLLAGCLPERLPARVHGYQPDRLRDRDHLHLLPRAVPVPLPLLRAPRLGWLLLRPPRDGDHAHLPVPNQRRRGGRGDDDAARRRDGHRRRDQRPERTGQV